MRRDYMTFFLFFPPKTFSFILLLVYSSDSECEWPLNCFNCFRYMYSSKCHIFYFFCVTEKCQLIMKIEWYKDSCYLNTFFW